MKDGSTVEHLFLVFGLLFMALGATIALPPSTILGVILFAFGAVLAKLWRSKFPEDEHVQQGSNPDYDMPDELRDMPEFAPIGGYKRMMRKRPKLSIVQEISLDRFEPQNRT